MNSSSPETVLARLEAALSRLEAAAAQTAPSQTDLAERHSRLRKAVAQSLEKLDLLIGEQKA
jgi:exonuclease VII small subunit